MSAAADFDVSSWLTGEKSAPFSSVSSTNDSLYAPLSIHVPDTKTMDHQLGLFSPLLLNEPQSMNLQTPTAHSSAAPFPFLQNNTNDNHHIKMENDSSVDEQSTNNLPAFDHGLSINSSVPTNVPAAVDHLSSAHLSPLSDASSPSDFEVDRYHPISPLSPSISGTQDENGYYQSVDQLFEDDDYQSPSTSPASPASSEISALSESTVNPNSATSMNLTTDNNQQPKLSKSVSGGKKKRAKRRNLLNALKEHLASTTNTSSSNGEEGTSESESELMHELTNRSTRTRGKRSASSVADGDDDKDDPASKRERNKQSASAYRKRRKMYLDTLESKVEVLNDKLTEQQQSMAKMENENKVLREQVSFLKRLISFKNANNEAENKENDDDAMHISSSSSYSSSGAFGATNSRLNLLNYSTTRSTNAGMFLFLLFSCFLLFNPMWSNDLSINNDGSSMEPVGRLSRKLLSYDDLSDPLNAAVYSSVKKEDSFAYMQKYFYGFPTQSTDTLLNRESSAPSSSAAAPSKNNHSEDVPLSSSSSSSSSSVRYPLTEVSDDVRSKALAELHSLAASFHMDPQSQQFAELVAASYLPLVNILGEAATRAALQELATGVFFLQHQTMLTAITAAADNNRNNSTAVPHS